MQGSHGNIHVINISIKITPLAVELGILVTGQTVCTCSLFCSGSVRLSRGV